MSSPKGRYAARLNSFRGPTARGTLDLLDRAAQARGLNEVDLNFPDHLDKLDLVQVRERLAANGLGLNGFAMRYYGEPGFKLGAFTNPDPVLRRKAIDLTKRGIDAMRDLGGSLMTLWMGQDGFDYSFQADYARLWDHTVAAIAEVADHDPAVDVSIEYKPNEPRAFSLMPDMGTTLLAIREVGRSNLGVTLDFAHVLYADEMPAHVAALAARHSRLLGVHLNDGYGKRDDGLMVGAVHPVQTVELLYTLDGMGYDRPLYFDTFPDATGLDPVAECEANIATVERLRKVVERLRRDNGLAAAIAAQDAVASAALVRAALYG
ncbi:MAG: sugar phosphate isomerase/epimerase family protein [Alsobacter sp.]